MTTHQDTKTSCCGGCGCGTKQKPHAANHWIAERLSAIALVPLTFWVVYSIVMLRDADYVTFITWLSAPLNAVLLGISLLMSYWHGAMGLNAIVDDYVSTPGTNRIVNCALKALFAVLSIIGVVAIGRIAL